VSFTLDVSECQKKYSDVITPNETQNSYNSIAIQSLLSSELIEYEGGVPTSLYARGVPTNPETESISRSQTTQQWDFPNAWAPQQMFLISGLRHAVESGGEEEAFQLAQKWISTTYNGWVQTQNMFEKYDCRVCGAPGGGESLCFLLDYTFSFLRFNF
jgi:neutral trehalase